MQSVLRKTPFHIPMNPPPPLYVPPVEPKVITSPFTSSVELNRKYAALRQSRLTTLEAEALRVEARPPFPFTSFNQPERFLSRILPKDAETGCEIWAGMTEGNAGVLTLGHKSKRAHRVAYEFHHGPIPPEHQVLQTCKNPLCCAKEHLYASPNPTKKPKPPPKPIGKPGKYSDDQIRTIRKFRSEGMTYHQLAEMFNTSDMMIYNICKFKAYKHVKPEENQQPQELP